jgi:hypothetical protein
MEPPIAILQPEPNLAQLCGTCQRMVLRDDIEVDGIEDSDSGGAADGKGHLRMSSPTSDRDLRHLGTDTLPDLPRLRQSWSDGCDFCDFLRTIIMSADVADVAVATFGKSLRDLGSRALEIYTQYHWERDDDACWESIEPWSVGTEGRDEGKLGIEDNPSQPQVKDESSSEHNSDEGVRRKLAGLVITLQVEGLSLPLALTCIPGSVLGMKFAVP